MTGPAWVNAGYTNSRFPSTTSTTPRSRMELPIVMMMMVAICEGSIFATAKRYSATPASTVSRIAAGMASQSGSRPAVTTRKAVTMPPSMTNSPWAKLMTLLAL
jgi:hypothetical protein